MAMIFDVDFGYVSGSLQLPELNKLHYIPSYAECVCDALWTNAKGWENPTKPPVSFQPLTESNATFTMHTPISMWICLIVVASIHSSQASGRLISLDLKSTPDDGQLFYVQVKVGERETKQTFNLLVATTYFITWLPSVQVSPSRGYANKSAARLAAPNQLHKTATGYGGHSLKIYTDTFELNTQITIPNQQFAVIYPARSPTKHFPEESQLDGMLGLNGNGLSDHLFRNLHKSSYIDHLKFSLYINNSATSDSDHPKGALVLGGVDPKYQKGEFQFVKMYEDSAVGPTWLYLMMKKTLIVSAIQLDWTPVGLDVKTSLDLPLSLRSGRLDLDSPPARLRLDSTAKLFIGDKKVLDKIHLDIIGATLLGEIGFYVFDDCRLDNKPDLLFSVDGLELRITPQDYVVRGAIDHSEQCLSAFKALAFVGPARVWVFGTTFLRKYYTLFDYENDVVGFAEPK